MLIQCQIVNVPAIAEIPHRCATGIAARCNTEKGNAILCLSI